MSVYPASSQGDRGAARRGEWACAAAVWLLILAYAVFFGALTVYKHDAFQTTAFDLGNVDQAVWNTRHGRPLAMTNIEGLDNRLGTHVEPILLPISLLYFAWSDPRTLLLLQTAVIALGAWPVYLLARRAASRGLPAGRGQWVATCALPVVFAAAYLLFPALQSANVFDFHAVALAPTFFLFALYCLETERWAGFAAFAVLLSSTKEDMPLLVIMLGLYLLWQSRGRAWRVAVPAVLVAGAWFVVAVGVIMPHFDTAQVSPLANRYAWLGDGPADIVATLLTRPAWVAGQALTAENLAYVRDWLAPLAFLPLLAPAVLLLAAPVLAVNLLSSDGFMHQLEGFHYGAVLAPIAVVAAAYGAAWLLRHLPRARLLPAVLALIVLAATLLYHRGHGYTPLAAGRRQTWPAVGTHDRLGAAMARRIPAAASLATLPYLNPHASQRQRLYVIEQAAGGQLAPLHDADYVWLDVTNSWPLHPNDLKAGADGLLAGGYGLAEADHGYLLLQRGAAAKEMPDAFYGFARADRPRPQVPLSLRFMLDGEPALELLGVDLERQRDGWVSTFYWRALRALPAGLRLYPFYVDDATGEILEDTTLRPMVETLWYPPERWRPGEVVKTRTLAWPVGDEFSLGIGVVHGADWDAAGSRLSIQVEASDVIVRLFDGNTWARLLHVRQGRVLPEPRRFDAPRADHALDADLGPVRLLGYDLERERASGDTPPSLQVTLYWQAEQRMDPSYAVFVQLLDADGRVRGQADGVPRGGAYPTFWWLPGEVVADEVAVELAPDAPPAGPYRLIAGLYDPATGARLVDAGGHDFIELAEVHW